MEEAIGKSGHALQHTSEVNLKGLKHQNKLFIKKDFALTVNSFLKKI